MEEKDIEFEMLSFLYENRDKNCTRDEMFNSFSGRVSQEVLSKVEFEIRSKKYCGHDANSNSYKIFDIGIHQLEFLKKGRAKEDAKEKREVASFIIARRGLIFAIVATIFAALALIKCDTSEEKHTEQIIEPVEICKIQSLQPAYQSSYIL